MTLAAGTRFGSFEITGLVGTGGMGEVYRATDPQLGRDVALKILPEANRLDSQAVMRFEREARLLASLNHPNVATLHGLAISGDAQALVMELVDGETLEERIARAPRGRGLPLNDVLEIATQIAAALDAAHEHAVVHRDLKPSNIKVRPDGTVKVLDFGIAKALAKKGQSDARVTVTRLPGAVVGTPSYMSPEQAAGADVDRRTDIWAFGCVLFEMLSGQRAFDGETDSRTLARVMEREPDWTHLPNGVPTQLRTLLRQCLEKDARKRRRDAGDIRLELERLKSEPALVDAVAAHRTGTAAWWVAGAAVLVAAATATAMYLRTPAPTASAPEIRLQVVTPATYAPQQFAVSPDGRNLVFLAAESPTSTRQRLYLRSLDSTEARPIGEPTDVRLPFWSPDSRSIGFYASEMINRIDIDGGSAQALALAPSGLGAAWGADGSILYSPDTLTPLYSVSASGGPAKPVTRLDAPRAQSHRAPSFLPDGRRFLFYAYGETEAAGIYLGSLDGTTPRRLVGTDGAGVFVAPDYVLFIQNGSLVARRLDLDREELTGETITVAAPGSDGLGAGGFSASANGVIAYRKTRKSLGSATTWFDAAGNAQKTERQFMNGPVLSPDERFLAYDRTIQGNRDVWITDLVRGGDRRFTTEDKVDGYPVWSPDGQQLVFESDRNGNFDLWIAPVNRVGEEQLFVGTDAQEIPLDWSSNGYVLYRRSAANYRSSDLVAVAVADEDRKPIVVADTQFEERMGSFSPDGKWVAYDTNRSGRYEVLVQAFPEPSGQFPISTNGGQAPLWSKDGSEIYFTAPDGAIMSARVTIDGSTFAAEAPDRLFPARVQGQAFNQEYAVTKDRRFVVNTVQINADPEPITVLLNWKP